MAVISAPGTIARGIRNNNPLNIEHREDNKWLGLADPPSDGRFCRFVSADYGVRAACTLLMRYYDRDNLKTVRSIVEKWAPATENNTNAYIAAVCRDTGFSSNEVLDLHDRATMRTLVAAMARHETGAVLHDIPLNRGLALAGFAAPLDGGSVLTTPTMVAATTVAVPAAAIAIGSIIEGIGEQSDVISGVVATIGGPAAGGIALGVITALTWGWNFYQRVQVRQNTGV